MKRLGLGIIVAIGLTLPAFADPPQLKGGYIFTYNDTCLASPNGFSPTNAALGQTFSQSSAATGTEHFNADGRTGLVTGTSLALDLGSPPLPADASTSHWTAQFTYAFNADGSFTVNVVPNSFVGTIPALGATFSVNGASWLGLVTNNAQSHTLTTLTPFVQVLTINTKPSPIIITRICRSNVVAFKLNPDE